MTTQRQFSAATKSRWHDATTGKSSRTAAEDMLDRLKAQWGDEIRFQAVARSQAERLPSDAPRAARKSTAKKALAQKLTSELSAPAKNGHKAHREVIEQKSSKKSAPKSPMTVFGKEIGTISIPPFCEEEHDSDDEGEGGAGIADGNDGDEDEDAYMEDGGDVDGDKKGGKRVASVDQDAIDDARVAGAENAIALLIEKVHRLEIQNQELKENNRRKSLPQTPDGPTPKIPGARCQSTGRNLLLNAIRKYRLQELGVISIRDPRGHLVEFGYPLEPQRPDEAWADLNYPEVFTSKSFTYAWSRGARHVYNQTSNDFLATKLISDVDFQTQHHVQLGERNKSEIKAILVSQWDYLKGKRLASLAHPVMTERQLVAAEAKRIENACNERRRTLWEDNVRLIHGVPQLAGCLYYWLILGPEGTSDDEDMGSRDGIRLYGIVKQPWRSAELEAFCRSLAALRTIKRPRNRFRNRVSSDMVSNAPAPKGLPENWYSKTWLEGLKRREREALQMADPVPLEMPAELIEE